MTTPTTTALRTPRRLPVLPALVALLTFVAVPSAASAHRLDEYLQATLVVIEPGDVRLRINLTPGVDVADEVLARIDRDRDGVVSAGEAAAYAALLKRDLTLRLDGRVVEPKLAASDFPAPDELRSGWGIIQVEFSAAPGPLAAGPHRLTLQNRHFPAAGAYLFNAAQPRSGAVRITRQNRNDNQSDGGIEFAFQPPPAAANPSSPSNPSGNFRTLGIFAFLAAPVVGVLVGVWRTRKRSPAVTPSGR